jgi:hypothetical protein
METQGLLLCVDRFRYRKDAYGFFLKPVDTTLVPDYLSVIKNPMDFGTMREKVVRNMYKSIDDFKV